MTHIISDSLGIVILCARQGTLENKEGSLTTTKLTSVHKRESYLGANSFTLIWRTVNVTVLPSAQNGGHKFHNIGKHGKKIHNIATKSNNVDCLLLTNAIRRFVNVQIICYGISYVVRCKNYVERTEHCCRRELHFSSRFILTAHISLLSEGD